ncbi:MAG TPA: hemerythrin domain-containing protein [Candidatus Binatia bacterium]|jgi:hemerythrin-like domain-containing protein|nr:hemerythrin domain-containing protein [Candidatus Binatia bacterium]
MPVKRHPSLIPLSHDHHHGLVLAFRLREGLPRNWQPADNPQEQATDTVRFFHNNLVAHFRVEEEVLFPAIRARVPHAATMLDALTAEHSEMRAQVENLAHALPDEVTLQTRLKAFGDLLERHIRREERELFPLYEFNISEAEAVRIGKDVARITKR